MFNPNDDFQEDEGPRGQVERRRKPFVPDHDRLVYPVDHVTSQRHALAKFEAETRIVVGGQLTRRIVHEACDLEDEIRARVHDNAQYAAARASLQAQIALLKAGAAPGYFQ